MSRPIAVIENDMNNVSLALMCCRDETQIERLIQRGEELRKELDQDNKEAGEQ